MQGSNEDYSNFGCHIPPCFSVTRKQRYRLAMRAYHYGNYPAWQLRKMLGKRACFYTLKWHNLFLTRADAQKHLIRNRAIIRKWKAAIRKHLKPPYFFCIEVGVEGEIHVHVIADRDAGLLGIKRGGKVIRPIGDTEEDWIRVLMYMYKTPVPLTVDYDDINAQKLSDWQERLSQHKRDLKIARLEGRKKFPQLSDYVFR